MGDFILESIDLIDQATMDSQCDVLSSLSNVYDKAFQLYDNSVDESIVESCLTMEAFKVVMAKEEPIRSQNFIAKFIRMIKRLWQQILTMVTNASLKSKLRKLRNHIDNTPGVEVPSPWDEKTLKWYIDFHDQMKKYEENTRDFSPDMFVNHLKIQKERIKSLDEQIQKAKGESLGTHDFVSKSLMLRYIDSVTEYIKTLKEQAKTVDKYLDNYRIYGDEMMANNQKINPSSDDEKNKSTFTKSKVEDVDIKTLNDASKILFECLRKEMTLFKTKIDRFFNKQFGESPKIQLRDDILLRHIEICVKHILRSQGDTTITTRDAVVIFDGNTSNQSIRKNIIPTIPEDFIKPENGYDNIIVIMLTNSTLDKIKKWNIIKGKTISDDVKHILGNNGSVIYRSMTSEEQVDQMRESDKEYEKMKAGTEDHIKDLAREGLDAINRFRKNRKSD